MTNKAKLVNARLDLHVNRGIMHDQSAHDDIRDIARGLDFVYQLRVLRLEELVYDEAAAA